MKTDPGPWVPLPPLPASALASAMASGLVALAVVLPLAAARPAAAERLRDAATGLAVDPPPGYSAAPMAVQGAQQARMVLRRSEDRDTGCQVAFVPAPQNESMSQEALNRLARSPGWQRVVTATLQPLYNVIGAEPFSQGGIDGVLLVAELLPRPGLPPRAEELRSLFAILETPRGRTTTVCSGEKAVFATRRGEFEAVARSVSPPR